MTEKPKMFPISGAREIGKSLGLRSVIVLQEMPDGRLGYTSWGRNKADCDRAKRIAGAAWEAAGDAADPDCWPTLNQD